MTGYISPRDLVRRGAERHGARLAITSPDANVTYSELAARTARVAEILRRAGVGPGIQVAMSLPNSVEFPAWYFGVLEAGGIVISLSPVHTTAEAEDLMRTAGVSFLIAPQDQSMPRELGFQPVATLDKAGQTAFWRNDRDPIKLATTPWTPNGYLVRVFSSGSTGRPKHILRTEFYTADRLRSYCETLGLQEGERFLAVASFGHTYGIGNLQAAYFLGGSVTVLPRFLPSQVIEISRRDKPTVLLMTPPMVESLATCLIEDGDERAFDSLKFCECSTGWLREAAYEGFLQRYGVSVRPRYGTTETLATAVDLDEGFVEGRVGRPFTRVTIDILDDSDNPCPAGVTGHVAIRSEGGPDHYVGDPEMSAQTFRNGYIFPGDMGYLDDQGRLHVLGRADIINIGGLKVDRLEVERVIRDALPVADVVVMEGERAGLPAIRAVIEGDPAEITRAMVIKACRAELSAHKVPAQVQIFEKFERDINGKALRSFFDVHAPEPRSPRGPGGPAQSNR
jgi:long-chain acyl-CoA synthetase